MSFMENPIQEKLKAPSSHDRMIFELLTIRKSLTKDQFLKVATSQHFGSFFYGMTNRKIR